MKRTSKAGFCVVTALTQASCSPEAPVPGVPAGTTWSYSAQISAANINNADILLVVSNAPSMRAKQELLARALPRMVERLLWPRCVDEAGNSTENPGTCPDGTVEEYEPWRDLRVGVITTSLGGHGSSACPREEEGKDDRALFIPKVRSDAPDPEGTGFLQWKGGSRDDLEAFISNLQSHVIAVGTSGCEAPAPLEAWYRALVDPNPPSEIVLDSNGLTLPRRSSTGDPLLDEEVLTQREEFLRPTSLLSIVVVSDQDDCSLMDGGSTYPNAGLGHRILDTETPMTRPTSACAENPNDACCFPCSEAEDVPFGCDVSACEGELALPPELDRASVRCFDTKRRFGMDFTYPISRYVHGLTLPQVLDDESGELVDNPLILGVGRHAGQRRDSGLVHFVGIVGVPWQDVSDERSLEDPSKLRLLTGYELHFKRFPSSRTDYSRWDLILGEPGLSEDDPSCAEDAPGCGAPPVPPLDPFLIPSIDARTVGLANPISGDVIASPDSMSPFSSNINGHEMDASVILPGLYPDGGPARDRLQPSCMSPLSEPLLCGPEQEGCLCSDQPARNTAACTQPAGGESSSTQYFTEAYPAPRILQVLRDFGESVVVAPICPKITTGDEGAPSFGFNPALAFFTERLANESRQRCFPRQLSPDEDGLLPCIVVEARPKGTPDDFFAEENQDPDNPCSLEGRTEINPTTRRYVESQLRESQRCDGTTGLACEDYHMCALKQLYGEAGRDCLMSPEVEDSGPPGYCYVDPSLKNKDGEYIAGGGLDQENRLVANCPASERRLLRFVGEDTPRPGSVTVIACQMLELSSSSEPGLEDLQRSLPFIGPERGKTEIPPAPATHEEPLP